MEMLQWSKPKSNKGPVFLPGIETYLKQIGQEFPDPQGEKYWSHQESRCSVLRSIEIAKDLRSYLSAKIYYYTRQNPDYESSFYTHSSEFKDSPYGCMHNRATGRKETSHCLRLNLRWETLLNSETVAPQWIRVCGPAQYGLKAARRAPQFSKRWFFSKCSKPWNRNGSRVFCFPLYSSLCALWLKELQSKSRPLFSIDFSCYYPDKTRGKIIKL